uniref:DM domain-containing protein n=1 Tax=Ditylenchus dipsaci TaxID=166011 RepID=A0A915CYG8_9BILA
MIEFLGGQGGQKVQKTVINFLLLTCSLKVELVVPLLGGNVSSSSKRIYYCQRCLNHGRLAPRKNHKAECIYSQCDCEKCILVERRRVLNTQLHELEELQEQPRVEQPNKSEMFRNHYSRTRSGENSRHAFQDISPSSNLSSPLSSAAQSPLSTSSVLLATADSTINDFFVSQQQSLFPSSASSPTGLRLKGERVPQCQKCSQHGRKVRLKGHKRFCAFKDCTCPKCQVITERQKLMADQIKIRRRQSKDTWMKLRRQRLTSDVSLGGGTNMTSQSSALDDDQSPLSNNYLSQLNKFYKNISSSSNHLASTFLSDSLYKSSPNCSSQSSLFDNPFLTSSSVQQHQPLVDYSNLNELIAEKQREIIAQMLASNAFKPNFNEPMDFSTKATASHWPNSSFSTPSQSIMDALLAKISQHQSQNTEISPPACSFSPTSSLLPTTPLYLNGLHPLAGAMSFPTLTTSPNSQFNFSSDGCAISLPSEDDTVNSQVSPPCLWNNTTEPNFTAQQLMLLQLINAQQQNGHQTDVEEQKEEELITSSSTSMSQLLQCC